MSAQVSPPSNRALPHAVVGPAPASAAARICETCGGDYHRAKRESEAAFAKRRFCLLECTHVGLSKAALRPVIPFLEAFVPPHRAIGRVAIALDTLGPMTAEEVQRVLGDVDLDELAPLMRGQIGAIRAEGTYLMFTQWESTERLEAARARVLRGVSEKAARASRKGERLAA